MDETHTSFTPRFRIRTHEGVELPIASMEALTLRVVRGDVLPETPLFDSGTKRWQRAGDVPVVRFLVEEASQQLQEPLDGWSGEVVPPGAPVPANGPDHHAPTEAPEPKSGVVATSAPTTPARPAAPATSPKTSPVGTVDAEPSSTSSAPSTGGPSIPAIPARGLPQEAVLSTRSVALSRLRTVSEPDPSVVVWTSERQTTDLPTRLRALLVDRLPTPTARRVAAGVVAVASTGVVAAFALLPQWGTEDAFADVTTPPIVRSALALGLGPIDLSEFPSDFLIPERASFQPPSPEPPLPAEVDESVASEIEAETPALPAPPPTVELADAPVGENVVSVAALPDPVNVDAIPLPRPAAVPSENEDVVRNEPVVRNGPVATRFDVPPQVSNMGQARSALRSEYPPELRAAGIGGRVQLYFFVNENGAPAQVQLHESSGRVELDAAAVRAARSFTFVPGEVGGAAVPGWVLIGVTFDGRE